jgi:hypothetical protein
MVGNLCEEIKSVWGAGTGEGSGGVSIMNVRKWE